MDNSIPNSSIFLLNNYHSELSIQLPSPAVLCGDLNVHNGLWNSDHLDTKGRVFYSVNDGSGMHLNSNVSSSNIQFCRLRYFCIPIKLIICCGSKAFCSGLKR